MFENELQTYEQVRKEYEQKVISRMDARGFSDEEIKDMLN